MLEKMKNWKCWKNEKWEIENKKKRKNLEQLKKGNKKPEKDVQNPEKIDDEVKQVSEFEKDELFNHCVILLL